MSHLNVAPSPTIDLVSLRCACGSADIVCVEPGSEPVISEATDILVDRGQPPRAKCLACWLPLRGYQQTLFGDHPTVPATARG